MWGEQEAGMNRKEIDLRRMVQQRLIQDPLDDPKELVAYMGAVQAQEYYETKWGLHLRMPSWGDQALEEAFAQGRILRTHAMRPTWHFLAPEDIRWVQRLTGHRVHRGSGHMYRRLELDEPVLQRSGEVFVQSLEGGRCLTRTELGQALGEAGIQASGMRLAYILMYWELEALICSGPRRGKQFTYALVAERAPQALDLEREEALAEFTRRYFRSHGPATEHDFSWWSGLTLGEVREGLALAGDALTAEVIDGTRYWFAADLVPVSPQAVEAFERRVFLLPTLDELLVGYGLHAGSRMGSRDLGGDELRFFATVTRGERILGSWRRLLRRDVVEVEVAPLHELSAEERQGLEEEAQRFGEFLGLRAVVRLVGKERPS